MCTQLFVGSRVGVLFLAAKVINRACTQSPKWGIIACKNNVKTLKSKLNEPYCQFENMSCRDVHN